MGLAYWINTQVASRYLKKPELTEFLNFQYPTLALQYAALVNELCFRLNVTIAPYVNSAAFELTNHCNLRCLMCPNSQEDLREKGFMDFALFKKFLEENPRLNLVQLNGWGEPFLHSGIIDFIRFAKSKAKRVYLYSNGTMIEGELISKILDSGLDRIVISIDGVDQTYERIRNYSYAKIENQVKELIEKRDRTKSSLVIDVSMVGSRETQENIEQFRERWKDRVNRVQVLSYFDHADKPRSKKCRELWRGNPQILWDGRVTVCCVDWDGELVFAKIGPDGYRLPKIWNCPRVRTLRYLHIKKKFHPACHRCNEYSSDIITNRFGD